MTAPNPFHPDLGGVARLLPRAIFTRRTFPLVRFGFQVFARLARSRSEKDTLPNGLRVLVHRPARPATSPAPALLWIHGGGLVLGAPEFEDRFCAALADALGIVVAAPAYRLAPAHPYPAALEDVDTALRWLAERPEVDPARIAVGGDSAGGGLAACLALHATSRAGPKPCFQLLHEPMLDAATCHRPDPDPAGLRFWNGNTNRFGWSAYLGGWDKPVPATASAAQASDAELARLPPAWLGCGTADLFHAETATYAGRLQACGVVATFDAVPGAFHGFVQYSSKAPVTRSYLAGMRAALAQGLGLAP
jgi:acetyl esterase/lipase